MKILSVFYLIAIFNLIFGYFLNLVSTDMVAIQPVDKIDTLCDLMDNPRFSNLTVVAVDGLWHEIALEASRPGSLEHRLYHHVIFLSFQFDDGLLDSIFMYGDQLAAGKSAWIPDRQAIPATISALCQWSQRDNCHHYHTSLDWFGERLLVQLVSKTSDENLVTWSRYKSRQIFESQIFQQLMEEIPMKANIFEGFSDFKNAFHFAFGRKEKESNHPIPFTNQFFIPLYKICFIIDIIAMIILIFERLISLLERKLLN